MTAITLRIAYSVRFIMKKKYELVIVTLHTIAIPPSHAVTLILGASYEKLNYNDKCEHKNYYTANTVYKNKFT